MAMISHNDINYRFLGLESLYGEGSLEKLRNSHIAILGIGGVGSWVAENLARSAVGKITLVDLDDICFSNINRQIHALSSTAGKLKTQVMKQRILDINPECDVICIERFYSEKSYEEILNHQYDFIIDAFDNAKLKTHLIIEARKRRHKLIITGGAAAKTRPQMVKVEDIALTINDPLLLRVRKELKTKHSLLKTYKNGKQKKKLGIPCVYSDEVVEKKASCLVESGCHGQGSVSFVTSQFANLACAYVINDILARPQVQYGK